MYHESDSDGNTRLFSVTLHELGHLLGIGYITFYQYGIISDQPIVNYTDTNEQVTKSYYTGQNAVNVYKEYFSNSDLRGIPIEDDGGSGTANVHGGRICKLWYNYCINKRQIYRRNLPSYIKQ